MALKRAPIESGDIDPDGSNPVQLTFGNSATAPACSPDGSRVFYIDSGANQIKQVPVEGGTPEAVPGSISMGASFLFQRLAISPDGRTLAVVETLSQKEHPAEPKHKIALIPLNAGANLSLLKTSSVHDQPCRSG